MYFFDVVDIADLSEGKKMEIGLILKIAGIGVLVSIISSILSKSGKDEQAMMLTVAGIIVVMLMLVEEIGTLIDTVQTVFGL
jgi:stage III sporulation protein AC